jgi:hypothetical protein
MGKYIYNQHTPGHIVLEKDEKPQDVIMSFGETYELPDDHKDVKKLLALNVLTPEAEVKEKKNKTKGQKALKKDPPPPPPPVGNGDNGEGQP